MDLNHTIAHSPHSYISLPYDIRVLVHSYLRSGQLLAPKLDCPGLYWSCRQAQEELDHIVHDQLKRLCAEIQNKSCGLIIIQRSPDDLRQITVVIPLTAFDRATRYFVPDQLLWKWEILTALHPLLAFHFDTIRIELSSQGCVTESIPSNRTLTDRVSFHNDSLRNLLHDLGLLIGILHVNMRIRIAGPRDEEDVLKHIFLDYKPPNRDAFPRGEIRAQRICLSWDFRKSPGQDAALSGRLVYGDDPHNVVARKIMRQLIEAKRSMQKTSLDPIFDPPYHQPSMVYYLRGDGHYVGEIGIVSLTRWQLKDHGDFPIHNRVGVFSTDPYRGDKTKTLAIKSAGLGMKIDRGSASEENKTHSEEAEALRLEYLEKKQDAIFRAYLEEGIMMD